MTGGDNRYHAGRIAPTPSEPPFVAAQVLVLIASIVLGVPAGRRFHPNVGVGALRAAQKGKSAVSPRSEPARRARS